MLHPSEATYRLSEVWFPQHEWSLSSNTSSPSAHIYNYSSKRKLIPSIQRYLSRLVLNCHWQFSLVFNFSHYFCRCPQIAISTLRFYKTILPSWQSYKSLQRGTSFYHSLSLPGTWSNSSLDISSTLLFRVLIETYLHALKSQVH